MQSQDYQINSTLRINQRLIINITWTISTTLVLKTYWYTITWNLASNPQNSMLTLASFLFVSWCKTRYVWRKMRCIGWKGLMDAWIWYVLLGIPLFLHDTLIAWSLWEGPDPSHKTVKQNMFQHQKNEQHGKEESMPLCTSNSFKILENW